MANIAGLEPLDFVLSCLDHLNLTHNVMDKTPALVACGGYGDIHKARLRRPSANSRASESSTVVAIKSLRANMRTEPSFAKVKLVLILTQHTFLIVFSGVR